MTNFTPGVWASSSCLLAISKLCHLVLHQRLKSVLNDNPTFTRNCFNFSLPWKTTKSLNFSFSYNHFRFALPTFLMSSITWFPFERKTAFCFFLHIKEVTVWFENGWAKIFCSILFTEVNPKQGKINIKTSSSIKVGIYNPSHKIWGQKMNRGAITNSTVER